MIEFPDGRKVENGSRVAVWFATEAGPHPVRGIVRDEVIYDDSGENYMVSWCYWSVWGAWARVRQLVGKQECLRLMYNGGRFPG